MKLDRLIWAALLACLPTPIFAAQPARPAVETGLILASGERARTERVVTYAPPPATRAAWARFLETVGSTWRGSFDAVTGAPIRVGGAGLSAPGSMSSPEIAARYAKDILERHVDLLAPGARATDLELVSNVSDGKMRTLGFVQRAGGLRVLGGQVSFRYKNDRLFMIGSEALPDVGLEPQGPSASETAARKAAEAWIAAALHVTPQVEGFKGRAILPLRDGPELSYRDVVEVRVRTRQPAGLYAVYLDARTLEPVARRQLLMFTSGHVAFNVPVRRPGGARVDRRVAGLSVSVGGTPVVTDADGTVNWAGAEATRISLGVTGPLVRVVNQSGATTSTSANLPPNGTFTWNASAREQIDAQLTSFVATQDVKTYLRPLVPRMPWLDQQLTVNTNLDDVCNAFSDGETINFFRAGMGCENTARLPDVVAHEAGHAIHFAAVIDGVGNFDSALSEGASDYLAATMTDDPQMGRGFFLTDEPLRDLDPQGVEKAWPQDINRDPHETGLIIGGALWDLRTAFVAELGRAAGVRAADVTWFAILERASDVPSSYAEAVAVDDDDGDLSNGTPHVCLINAAFGRHGLVDRVNAGPGIGVPTLDAESRTVSFPFQPRDQCPGSNITSATITWRDAQDSARTGTVTMSLVPGGGSFSGVLPAPEKPGVVTYRVRMSFDDGATLAFPDNPADPEYQAFVGTVIPLFCTDFERNPETFGWSHALEASMPGGGGMPVDDWQWGPIQTIPNSSDPAEAYSGQRVVGTDLGLQMAGRVDGRYQSNATTALLSPPVDVMGHTSVHLQYRRWLTVEDGVNDQATISANDAVLWSNLASPRSSDPLLQGLIPHLDKEWRFHDVDLSESIVDGQVQVKFSLAANRRRSYGGWTLDDFCVVAVAVCGNGLVETGEQCDDQNTDETDGCTASCATAPLGPQCGNGAVETGEQCDDGTNDGTRCTSTCTLPVPPAMCGNGKVEAGEQCDEGNNDGTRCSANCTLPLTTVEESGCGCRSSGSASGLESLALGALILAASRRRRPR